MVEPYQGPLIKWTIGPPDASPVLLLHDRYQDQDELLELGNQLVQQRRVIRVRGARTQMEDTYIKGYYWFFGPNSRPELSTLGDGLFHLETLALHQADQGPDGKFALVGKGEGGVMALTLSLIWPDRISAVVAIGASLPDNFDDLPLNIPPAADFPVLLVDDPASATRASGPLQSRGCRVEILSDETAVAPWLLAQQQ